MSVGSHAGVGISGVLVGLAAGWWLAPMPGSIAVAPTTRVVEVAGAPVIVEVPVAREAADVPAPEDCDARVAKVEDWCSAQVWAAGGALPVAWPDDVPEGWRRDEVEAALEAAMETCLPADIWARVDCDEFPCVLHHEGSSGLSRDCQGLPPYFQSRTIASSMGELQSRFFYPPEIPEGSAAVHDRRDKIRIETAWDEMLAAQDEG